MNTGKALALVDRPDDWRLQEAAGEEAKARRLAEVLHGLEDAHAIAEADGLTAAATEIRGTCSLLRSMAASCTDVARDLRSAARDEPHPELPRATTTRRPR